MATLKTYVQNLWATEKTIYGKLGGDAGDLRIVPFSMRLVVLTMDVVLAVIVKVMVDKGLLTDAELKTAFDTAAGLDYPEQPEQAPRDDADLNTSAVDPNMGA